MSESKIKTLKERHMCSILLFVLDHPGCMKSDIYPIVSNNPNMPRKLESLETLGLLNLQSRRGSTATFVDLTERGRMVAEHLR